MTSSNSSRPPVSLPVWVLAALVLTLVFAAVSVSYRIRAEERNKAVGLVVELDTVQELAASEGLDLTAALAKLKAVGLTGVVLGEETVADLVADGRISLFVPSEEQRSASSRPPMRQAQIWMDGRPEDLERVRQGLAVRFGVEGPAASDGPIGVLELPDLPAAVIRRTPIGLDPALAAAASEAGLDLVGRYSNTPGATEETIARTLAEAKRQGVKVFLPQGEQVLGRRDNLKVLASELQRHGILYATPEFAKIGGDANVVAITPENTVRLHAAQAAELDKLPLAEAVERYAKAARERNIRVLLLRPLTQSAAQPLGAFSEFVRTVRRAVEKDGMLIRTPHPFSESGVPRPLYVLIGLSAAAVVFWVASAFVRDRRLQALGAIALALAALGCWIEPGRQGVALLAAIAFPVGAFLILDGRRWRHWLLPYAVASLVSLVGGLVVAALLNELKFFVRADQFEGVKLAHFLPLALVGGWFFWRLGDPRKSMESSVRWGQALLAMVMFVAFAFMATRTGNDNPAGVSGLELKIRALLDAVLFVRPRTKEFLIGHPMLVVGIVWLIAGAARAAALQARGETVEAQGGWTALALMAGAIGQTSIVNTLCHLHTPVTLSLARIGVGWVAGGILGALLVWILGRKRHEVPPASTANEGL